MRERRGPIENALNFGISNGRVEGLNTIVRLIIRRAYGFHSAEAALALVMLSCGPIGLDLPHEHSPEKVAQHNSNEGQEDRIMAPHRHLAARCLDRILSFGYRRLEAVPVE